MGFRNKSKRWNLLCRIYSYNNGKEFRLVEKTPKGKVKFKVTISENDALYLINVLQLKNVKHDLLKTTSTVDLIIS